MSAPMGPHSRSSFAMRFRGAQPFKVSMSVLLAASGGDDYRFPAFPVAM